MTTRKSSIISQHFSICKNAQEREKTKLSTSMWEKNKKELLNGLMHLKAAHILVQESPKRKKSRQIADSSVKNKLFPRHIPNLSTCPIIFLV